MKITNARVESTFLGRESHGIFVAIINLKGLWGCYALEFCLSDGDGFKPEGFAWIDVLLHLFGKAWEELPGTFCRVAIDNDKVIGVGHLIEESWIYQADSANRNIELRTLKDKQ